MLCSLTCSLVAAAPDSISEAVQLESPTTPAQHWRFHGVTALKFAEGRGQAGPEGCEGSIVRELAPSHAAQHFGCSDADRSHQVQERPSLKEHNEASACKKPSCNILKSLVWTVALGQVPSGLRLVAYLVVRAPASQKLPSTCRWDNIQNASLPASNKPVAMLSSF